MSDIREPVVKPGLRTTRARRVRGTRMRTISRTRACAAAASIALVAMCAAPVSAQVPPPESFPSGSEWALLPPYCPDTNEFGKYGKSSPNAPKWVALMGETFWALHHYCFGILKFERAQQHEYSQVIRQGLLTSAISEFQFVIRVMPDNYVLAPEIYTYVGRTYLLKNEPMQAEMAFAKARAVKPDYWPAYSWLARWLEHHGQRDKALQVVDDGLKHAPDSRTLMLIRKELGQ